MVRWGTSFVGAGCCRTEGLGQAVVVSCFYWAVAHGSTDGQASVDDVDRDYWRLSSN